MSTFVALSEFVLCTKDYQLDSLFVIICRRRGFHCSLFHSSLHSLLMGGVPSCMHFVTSVILVASTMKSVKNKIGNWRDINFKQKENFLYYMAQLFICFRNRIGRCGLLTFFVVLLFKIVTRYDVLNNI